MAEIAGPTQKPQTDWGKVATIGILVGGGIYLLNNIGGSVVDVAHGIIYGDANLSVDKVPFDFERTQKILVSTGTPGEFVEVSDPWTPNALASELASAMSGINRLEFGETDRSKVWKKIGPLGRDRRKWLHNYWLEEVDPKDTLFRWISSQTVWRWSEEHEQREFAEDKLRDAEVGF